MIKHLSAYPELNIKEKSERHIMVVWVDNESGVLARIAGLFSGRGYNIESLAVAQVDDEKHISRITIATNGTKSVIHQIKAQLLKLVPVHKVASYEVNNKSIFRELALLKVLVTGNKLKKVKKLCNSVKAKILDQTKNSMVIEFNSYQEDIDKLIKSLKPLGLASISRTGPLAMVKGAELKEVNKGKVI